MNYAGCVKKEDENSSKKTSRPSRQPVPAERSSDKILAILHQSQGKSRCSRIQNEGPNSSGVKTQIGFKLERNFPKKGNVVFEESAEDRNKRLIKAIETHESVFQWNKTAPLRETSVSKLQEKIKEVKEERVGLFKWRNFCLSLALSFEYYQASDLESSLKVIEQLESTILSIGMKDDTDYFFIGIYDALDHVVVASKAFLLLKMEKLREAEKLLPRIQSVERMRRSARAGMFGIRAAVFMEYGLKGNQIALKQLTVALDLDKSTAEWFFLQGKCMARIRRMVNCNDSVSVDEMQSLTRAVTRDKNNSVYLIYLAQSLRDKAMRDMRNAPKPVVKPCKNARGKISVYSEEAKKAEKTFTAAYYMMRYGFFTMWQGSSGEESRKRKNTDKSCFYHGETPVPYGDLKLATEWLDKALEKAPNNSMAHHVKGMILDRFGVDPEKAMAELSTAEQLGNYAAALGVVRIAFRLEHDDIIERFETLATVFSDSVRLQNTYAQAGSYLLFIKTDFCAAATYFLKVIDLNPESYHLKFHKSMFLRMEDPVNLFNVLQTELSESLVWETFSKEEQKVLRTLSIKMYSIKDEDGEKEKVYVRNIIDQSQQLLNRDTKARSKRPRKKFVWRGTNSKKKKKDGDSAEKKMTEAPASKTASLIDWNDRVDSKLTPECMSLADKFMIQSQLSTSSFSLQRYPSNSSFSSASSVCSDFSRASYKSTSQDSRKSTGSDHDNFVESELVNLPKRTSGISDMAFASGSERGHLDASSDSESVLSMDSGRSMMDLRRGSASSARSSSVMERVKQSNQMLDYKKGAQPPQSDRKPNKLNRTDSTQSLHTEPRRRESSGRQMGSMQSLDSLDTQFKQTFTFNSSRSTFMPKFAKQ